MEFNYMYIIYSKNKFSVIGYTVPDLKIMEIFSF